MPVTAALQAGRGRQGQAGACRQACRQLLCSLDVAAAGALPIAWLDLHAGLGAGLRSAIATPIAATIASLGCLGHAWRHLSSIALGHTALVALLAEVEAAKGGERKEREGSNTGSQIQQ